MQPQTVRMVLAGLTLVYLVGLLFDLRGRPVAQAIEAVVFVLLAAIVTLSSRWWEPKGAPTPRPRVRVFVGLAGLAALVQIVGLVVDGADPADLPINLPPLLLLGVLFLNSFG